MRNSVGLISKLLGAAILFFATGQGFAAVYAIAPGTSLHLSGNLTIDLGILSATSALQEVAPGSLTTTLSGSLVAVPGTAQLAFPGGSMLVALDSGPWGPTGGPAAFGMKADFAFVSPAGTATVKFVGDIHNLTFDLTGSSTLSGSAGNQSFTTAGLNLLTTSGIWEGNVTACTPDCGDPVPYSIDVSGPPADPLAPGAGTLVTNAASQTLSLPLVVSTTDSETELVEGIEVTVSGTLTLTAQSVVAVTAVPEPSTWALLLAGAAAVLARLCSAGHGSALRRLA